MTRECAAGRGCQGKRMCGCGEGAAHLAVKLDTKARPLDDGPDRLTLLRLDDLVALLREGALDGALRLRRSLCLPRRKLVLTPSEIGIACVEASLLLLRGAAPESPKPVHLRDRRARRHAAAGHRDHVRLRRGAEPEHEEERAERREHRELWKVSEAF